MEGGTVSSFTPTKSGDTLRIQQCIEVLAILKGACTKVSIPLKGAAWGQRRCITRNVSAAQICNQFSVVPPGSWIREKCLFLD